jgi:thiaminase
VLNIQRAEVKRGNCGTVCYSYFGYLSDMSNFGCFDNCVGVLVICAFVYAVFLYYFVYVYLFLFATTVRSAATE